MTPLAKQAELSSAVHTSVCVVRAGTQGQGSYPVQRVPRGIPQTLLRDVLLQRSRKMLQALAGLSAVRVCNMHTCFHAQKLCVDHTSCGVQVQDRSVMAAGLPHSM
jgi:hypothetical protein